MVVNGANGGEPAPLTPAEHPFILLNVSSIDVGDLSTPARIRRAAFALFARHGIRATTVRLIAEEAGVSPGLVIHHFGSKDGLRAACDEWLLERLGAEKSAVLGGDRHALDDMGAQLAELAPWMDYISAALAEGGDGADKLFDRICEMTDRLVASGEATGSIRTPEDRIAWVTTLTAYTCGASLLGGQIARRLGGSRLLDPQVYTRYALASVDLMTNGMFADDRFLKLVRRALTDPVTGASTPTPEDPT